jgi:hypothetical protein
MIYIDNYSDFVTNELINHLSNKTGDIVPVWQPERWKGNKKLDHYRNLCQPWFENKSPIFHQFNAKSLDMENFNFQIPILPKTRKNMFWWFIKLLPGEMQTMHIDPHLLDVKNPVRYTMFLQDYHPGHIFVYENVLANNYKKGDLYEWSDPEIVHGVVNISYKIRLTLQITLHD